MQKFDTPAAAQVFTGITRRRWLDESRGGHGHQEPGAPEKHKLSHRKYEQLLRDNFIPTGQRARLYDQDGLLIADSFQVSEEISGGPLPPALPAAQRGSSPRARRSAMITINQQTHGGEWRLIGVFSEIRSVVVFSRRSSCPCLGARSAFTKAVTMLSISIPEPIPVMPAMLHLVKTMTVYA